MIKFMDKYHKEFFNKKIMETERYCQKTNQCMKKKCRTINSLKNINYN